MVPSRLSTPSFLQHPYIRDCAKSDAQGNSADSSQLFPTHPSTDYPRAFMPDKICVRKTKKCNYLCVHLAT
ncbi:hypothetical protein POVWA2_044150 [Plasmodium ovale wallikeri]|uniref:Uncharacterized protein n=1 Tax=Plasmodium ovale wallikeri TaxID=864142 RepID=A0A1A8ZFG7_PLAOA|nr:hypothetical protein POVWA1_045590 [Plasmodium ovale wallikeri]SBT42614.1 hypothetical protein POVWA2_044150 [Plasmodium ovale wallikeri]